MNAKIRAALQAAVDTLKLSLAVAAVLVAALVSPVVAANFSTLPSTPAFNEPSQIVATLNTLILQMNAQGPGLTGSAPNQTPTTGTTIQALGTVTIPAGILANPGQAIRVTCFGAGTVTGTNTLTLQFGTSTAFAIAGAATTAGQFQGYQLIMKTGASTQEVFSYGSFNTTFTTPTTIAATQTDTGPINETCSGTSTTSGQFTLNGMIVEQIK
jgi:hypothetical protein